MIDAATLASLNDAERAELELLIAIGSTWKPNPGPQAMAYGSRADILFFGGAASGGKTALLLGLPRHEHRRSIVFRRLYPSLQEAIDKSMAWFDDQGTYNDKLHRWKFNDGRTLRFGGVEHDASVKAWQGQPHDFYGFDEITEFTEGQFRFLTGWNRTTIKGQRCRVVCTGNPPTDSDGEWVVEFWAPWLKENHPNPALPGELRWFTTVGGKDIEVPNGDPLETLEYVKTNYPSDFAKMNGPKGPPKELRPLSRTFIPALPQDNPYTQPEYLARLQGMPEPLRSQLLFGDFRAGRQDAAFQTIPSEWVTAAQERWKARPRPTTPMTALGLDVARGGKDQTAAAPRYDNWFDHLRTQPGKSTPDGPAVAEFATLVLFESPGHGVLAKVNIDVIAVGSSPYDCLRNGWVDAAGDKHDGIKERAVPINFGEGSIARDVTNVFSFLNLRAELYWRLREALDPASGQDLALPPDPELKADLCAPKWKPTARGIQIESKDDVIERIGRSPDKGDAVVMAHGVKMVPGGGVFDFLKSEAEKKKAAEQRPPIQLFPPRT